MQNRLFHSCKRLLPFLCFSCLAGFLTAVLGSLFKLAAEWAVSVSASVYEAVSLRPLWIPVLIAGTALLGLAASVLVSRVQSCKGGGIPASVAAVRGIVPFKWLPTVLALPLSALISFFCGLPLGTEGPCVQLGTAIGDGVSRCFKKQQNRGWRRYLMTGGASAGFAVATASPISAILFSVEELHKKYSPLLLCGVAVSVMTAELTVSLLALTGIASGSLFHLPTIGTLPVNELFVVLPVGLVCGLGAVLFTRFYHAIEKAVRTVMKRLPAALVFPILFACISVVGVFLFDALGTGHGLIDRLFHARSVWYLLLLIFLLRAVFMMVSNTAGVTGGVFLPTLAFGAMLGSLCAEGMIALGLLVPSHYPLMVLLGIAAFLGASSRIPLTACVFAVESLGGIGNILPIVLTTLIAYLIAELSGVEDFTDAVIEAKEHSIRKDAAPLTVEVPLTVQENAFAVGKKPNDILWPNACVVISLERAHGTNGAAGILPNDVLTVRYQTYDPAVTAEELILLVGEQEASVRALLFP